MQFKHQKNTRMMVNWQIPSYPKVPESMIAKVAEEVIIGSLVRSEAYNGLDLANKTGDSWEIKTPLTAELSFGESTKDLCLQCNLEKLILDKATRSFEFPERLLKLNIKMP